MVPSRISAIKKRLDESLKAFAERPLQEPISPHGLPNGRAISVARDMSEGGHRTNADVLPPTADGQLRVSGVSEADIEAP